MSVITIDYSELEMLQVSLKEKDMRIEILTGIDLVNKIVLSDLVVQYLTMHRQFLLLPPKEPEPVDVENNRSTQIVKIDEKITETRAHITELSTAWEKFLRSHEQTARIFVNIFNTMREMSGGKL